MSGDATPICRCRVLYLGSAVPHITKDGLQGIQEPLRELYPEQGALGARGIDSWLSVWSNGILLENVDENHKKVTRFFPIDALHYCAAVRYVLVPEKTPASSSQPRFLPLDSPFARSPNPNHPPLFACILRRTTGIKVLECHTFICKREMAANALVRCCFHAYADSSYARHIDYGSGSNTYGSVAKEPDFLDKEEAWRKSAVTGSTLTLDSSINNSTNNNNTNGSSLMFGNEFSRSNDDISIYNGDENHKIWAGSGRDASDGEEGIYGEYGIAGGGSVKSGKTARPRQIISAAPPPPPPTNEEKKTKDKSSGRRRRGHPENDGHHMKSHSSSLRSAPFVVPVPPSTVPHLRRGRLLPAPATFHHMPPPPPPPPPLFYQTAKRPPRPYPLSMEEPIYMPSNRPMSPVSSYQPCHFPIEAYLMHHYATMNYNYGRKGKSKGSKKGAMKIVPVPMPEDWAPPPMRNGRKPSEEEMMTEGRKHVVSPGGEENGESPYNTGIYRRKGHMNERAFSYSIRQEHRSRSYGSLANLKFAPLPTVPPEAVYFDGPSHNKEEIKKEREIMQMMQDLELSADDIERSEVPPNVYQQTRQRNSQIRR